METNTNEDMKRFQITSQRELRNAFRQFCEECPCGDSCTFARSGKHFTRFNLDASMCFHEWKDGLHRDGVISDRLVFSATLF